MCAKHNIKVQQIQKEHFKVPPQPMEFIAMDLIGEFHPPPKQRKQVCTHSGMHADRIYLLHPNKIQESRGCNESIHRQHMLLDSESQKYLGNEEGLLNIELMRKLYHVIAYNLAKSRATQDGNKYAKEHYHPRPKVLEPGKNVLVRDHDSKVFKPKYLDYCVVKMAGKNQVIVKDNHGHETKVHRRDLKVIDF